MSMIVHGAGMNMRGKAQIDIFGPMTLPQYDEHIRKYASELGIEVEIFHSNLEREVINKFYEAHDRGSTRRSSIPRATPPAIPR
jgi:3-dehydroquinate dehydratase-2